MRNPNDKPLGCVHYDLVAGRDETHCHSLGVPSESKGKRVLEWCKTRRVAKGFSQKAEMDFGEMYSPVINYTTLWIFLALVAQRQLRKV